MSITDIVAALGSHSYLALFVFAALYVRKLSSPDSKFPLAIAPQWRPVVSAAAGLLYGALVAKQAGASWGTVALGAAVAAGAGGFLDGILTAIWNHNDAPAWARAIVFLFDDITGAGTPPQAPPGPPMLPKPPAIRFGLKAHPTLLKELPKMPKPLIGASPVPESLPPPTLKLSSLPALWLASALVFGTSVVVALFVACNPSKPLPPQTGGDVQAEINCVEQKLFAGDTVISSLAQCVGGDIKIATDIVEWLLTEKSVLAQLPDTSPPMLRGNIRQARMQMQEMKP